jgi:hypothetical protein
MENAIKKNHFSELRLFFLNGLTTCWSKFSAFIRDRVGSGIKNWIFLICLAALFFTSDYLFTNASFYIAIVLVVLLAVLYFLYSFPFRLFKKEAGEKRPFSRFAKGFVDFPFFFALLFLISIVISFFANRTYGHFFSYLGPAMYVIAGYLFVSCYSFDEFVHLFTKFFPVLCFISLLFFIPVQIVGLIPECFIDYSGKAARYSLLFIDGFLEYYQGKNQGIFWEPGINASFLLLGLLLECVFKKEKVNKVAVAIELIALLTSKSLAGYLLLIPVILIIWCKKKPSKAITIVTYILLALSVLAIVFYSKISGFIAVILPAISEKGISLSTRLYSLIVDLKIWVQYPIFGTGPEHFYVLFPQLVASTYSDVLDASVSTTGFYIVVFGLIGWVIFLLYLVGVLGLKNEPWVVRIGLLFVSFLILNKEPHISDITSWVLFFYLMNFTFNHRFLKWDEKYSQFGKLCWLNKNRCVTVKKEIRDLNIDYDVFKI